MIDRLRLALQWGSHISSGLRSQFLFGCAHIKNLGTLAWNAPPWLLPRGKKLFSWFIELPLLLPNHNAHRALYNHYTQTQGRCLTIFFEVLDITINYRKCTYRRIWLCNRKLTAFIKPPAPLSVQVLYVDMVEVVSETWNAKSTRSLSSEKSSLCFAGQSK